MEKKSSRIQNLILSRGVLDKYQIAELLLSDTKIYKFDNYHSIRTFVQKINEKRNVIEFPEHAINSGDANGYGLLQEIMHYVIEMYKKEKKQSILQDAYNQLYLKFGSKKIETVITTFIDEFPPPLIYKNEIDISNFLKNISDGVDNKHVVLEDIILLWISNINPALTSFTEIFNDEKLEKNTVYNEVISELHSFFNDQPFFGPDNTNLLTMLQSPIKAEPHSISGQLEWIREHWGRILPSKFFYRILRGLDMIKEETKDRGMGPGPSVEYSYTDKIYEEYEKFSKDLDWMPKVVLLAKNTHVWLHQLSEKYNCSITRLNEIPDDELESLANQGFTGLWLIGLWERSKASKKVKQMMGNPEAVASAYSLYDYIIADDLGGESAYAVLRQRAQKYNIKLCGDMVPNHVGIDGKWVIEHPDWFVQLDQSPFPSYSFNSTDICDDDRINIHLEDHYYERTDASVVFKRVDSQTGEIKYIYHGNDGTSMPWNDTAQLNYLKKEVREAVIQTILHVARNFDIIRFDAAMTLAKKHFQRLWFPHPGTGGDIASRAEHGMTKEEFDNFFPLEFWREVVDRVAEEEPDTLLLAEAFWLMEGYFVRTLGMHRVYNSAFMHMLKNEDNEKYRNTIKNVLEYNPGILKRFVNFMNNPDEETAYSQFGNDDKYFGTCIMLATLPGLPMFGHGQIEGLKEKYGMEYKKAYWNESPDQFLIDRHKREIFPVLHKRYLFAEVDNFLFYDFFDSNGFVNENIFAYSNQVGNEYGLVIYNNKYENSTGWIKTSVPFDKKEENSDNSSLITKNLGEGLNLKNDSDFFVIFQDQITGMEYIRNCKDIHDHGIFIDIKSFKYHVFMNFREVYNSDQMYSGLSSFLEGRGVPNINEAIQEALLQSVHKASLSVFNHKLFDQVFNKNLSTKNKQEKFISDMSDSFITFITEIKTFTENKGSLDVVLNDIINILDINFNFDEIIANYKLDSNTEYKSIIEIIQKNKKECVIYYSWLMVHSLGKISNIDDYVEISRSWIDELYLGKIITEFGKNVGLDENQQIYVLDLVKILTLFHNISNTFNEEKLSTYSLVKNMLQHESIRSFIGINRYKDTLWYNKEKFEELLLWLKNISVIQILTFDKKPKIDVKKRLEDLQNIITRIDMAVDKSEYKLSKLLEALK